MNLKYAIIGTGALGGFYGGRLANAGCDVHFLLNRDYEYVKLNGLKIDSIDGDLHLKNVNAYQSTTQMPVCDVVFVCLKTNNNHLLADILPPILHKSTIVVLVQNGLCMENNLAEIFPDISIAGGMAFICSSKIGAGHIAHYDYGRLTMGFHRGADDLLMQHICEDLNRAGVPADVSQNLNQARWQKLVWNIPYNGLTVVLNTTTDVLMKNTYSRQLVQDLMTEVVQAANYCGASVPDDFVEKMMRYTDKMKPYLPSMKVDFDNKRPLEIQAIYANPIQTAARVGFEMSKTTMLMQQLQFIESTYL